MTPPSADTEVREPFLALVHADGFIQRMLLHMINHRVQDFQDPLTSTLVLMATAPLQFVLCEAGLLLFKTNLLPVFPYGLLHAEERAQLRAILERTAAEQLHETIESSGQYTLSVLPFTQNPASSPTVHLMCKVRLLLAFVDLMRRQQQQQPQGQAQPSAAGGSGSGSSDAVINHTLSSIVLQRFWSRVSTPSEAVGVVMRHLTSAAPAAPPAPAPAPPHAEAEAEAGAGAEAKTTPAAAAQPPPQKRPKLL